MGRAVSTIILFLLMVVMIVTGHGGTMMRGFAWGMGREAAHHAWRR